MEVQRWLISSFRQCVWSNIKTSWLKGSWCCLPGQKRLICLGCRFVPETGIHKQEIIWLLMVVAWPFEDRACCIQWIVYHIIIWGVWRMGWQQSHSCSLSGFWCVQKHIMILKEILICLLSCLLPLIIDQLWQMAAPLWSWFCWKFLPAVAMCLIIGSHLIVGVFSLSLKGLYLAI